MKTLLLFAGILCLHSARAQFNKEYFGSDMPGVILMTDGTTKKTNIKYEHPDLMKDPSHPLMTSDGPLAKSLVKVFSYAGRPWVLRKTPINGDNAVWVVQLRQGAIDDYMYVSTDSKGKNSDIVGTSEFYKKGDKTVVSTSLLFGFKKTVSDFVSDYPELAAKIGTSGYGSGQMDKIVEEYNAWYEKSNPGKLTYLPEEYGIDIPGKEKPKTEIKSLGDAFSKDKNENAKKLEDAFAGRSTTVVAAFASAKANQPVKKETFGGKMARIKADGNKIGVLLLLKPVHVNPEKNRGTIQTVMSEDVTIEGQIDDPSLQSLGADLVAELNAALNTTDFELIDLMNVPYREVKVMGIHARVDDFWATKYKVVFAYNVDPMIRATHDKFGSDVTFNGQIQFTSNLVVTEYIGDVTSNKQDIYAQAITFGNFTSPSIQQKEDIKDINELYNKLLQKLGAPIAEKAKAERAASLKKFVEKKLTP